MNPRPEKFLIRSGSQLIPSFLVSSDSFLFFFIYIFLLLSYQTAEIPYCSSRDESFTTISEARFWQLFQSMQHMWSWYWYADFTEVSINCLLDEYSQQDATRESSQHKSLRLHSARMAAPQRQDAKGSSHFHCRAEKYG